MSGDRVRAFEAEVRKAAGKTFIALPFDPDAEWGERARHHVTGTVAGAKIRGPIASLEGGAVVLLPPGWLRDNPLAVGDSVPVRLEPEGPQLEALDADIAAALDANPAAKAFFASLATFYRKGYLTWLSGAARRPDVRKQRLSEFVALLAEGEKERPR